MEIPTRNKLLQEDNSFQESALQKTLFGYYQQCFEHPQDFNSLVYSGGAIDPHPDRIMQVGFNSSSSKRRKAAPADVIQVHHGGSGGGGVIRAGRGRKDRHSKVCTARGTRDRRVRLSPKTAIQFYDVQDRLGYDRPSKAIDWLMKEAKSAIDALHLYAPPPPLPNITDNYFVDSTNCFAENYRDGLSFDCFSSTNNGVAAPLISSSDQFQVFPVVDETPEEYSIVDPRFQEACATWNYARQEEIMFSQREPLQSIYPIIPGITFSNQGLLPNFTAVNSLLHFQE